MKLLAWAMVLVTTGVAAAQQPAANTQTKTGNAKATQDNAKKDSAGASGKDTQGQTKVNTVSATVPTAAAKTTPAKEENKQTKTVEVKKPVTATTPAAAPVPLHQHPTMVTMLQRSNGIRGRLGLRGHRLNPALCQAAQNHAEYMASTGSFSHDTNGGYVYRARRFGFRGNVRENIGWNYANTEQVFAGWQGSGGHYAAIVSPETTEAGFGFARAANGQTYWVSVYGGATTADDADAKAIFAKDKLAVEEAAKKAAEGIYDSEVVQASAEVEVKTEKPVAPATAKPAGQPAKTAPAKKPAAPVTVGG